MVFIKLVRHEGNKTIHETLDLPNGDGKHIGNDKLLIYEGCMNEDKAIAIYPEDLEKLYRMKKEK